MSVATTNWTAFTDDLNINPLSKLYSIFMEELILNVDIKYIMKKISISFNPNYSNNLLLLRQIRKMELVRQKSNSEGGNFSSRDQGGLTLWDKSSGTAAWWWPCSAAY